jgi:hypothetical protein
VDEKDQNGLDEKAISLPPKTAGAGESANGSAPSVAREPQQDAEHISHASAANINSQAVRPTPDETASQEPKAIKGLQALESNASGSLLLVSDTAISAEYVASGEPRKPEERNVVPISQSDLSKPGTTMEHLHKMSVGELKVLDALSNEGRQIIKTRLMTIWDEMSVRFERGESINGISGTGGKGMGKYLRSIGVRPAKRRSWKFEIAREETLRLAQENPRSKRTPKKKEIVINSETEADLIAKAGVKMAQLLAGDGMTPPQECINKAGAVAKEIPDAIEDGQYKALESLPHANETAPQIATQLLSPIKPEEEDDEDDALIEHYDPNREQPQGRPIYTIMLTVTGSRLESTLKKAQEAFGDKLLNVEKVSRISSRADEMGEAVGMIQSAKSVCEDLKDQIERWKDNLPKNLQDKASELEECVDALDQVISSLDEAEGNAESVEFPGMY